MSLLNLHPRKEIIDLIEARFLGGGNPILVELAALGFEYRLLQLYEEFQQGEISLEYLAKQLGLNIWEAHRLLESRSLRTSNL